MATSGNTRQVAKEEYDRALSLMQYHIQLLWQEFGAFLLAETVLIGFLGTILAQEGTVAGNRLLTFGGAILGLLLCIPWWSTYWHNYKYYELRITQARGHEKALGISLLTDGKKLSSGDSVSIDGLTIRHPFSARLLPPRRAVPWLIVIFGLAFLALTVFTWPKMTFTWPKMMFSNKEAQMESIFSGVITGIATAALLGIMALGWRKWREWRVKQLGDLMGLIIEHRNAGRHPVPDPSVWVQKAKELEQEAERKAGTVSAASGLLIHWLGEFPEISVDAKVKDPDQKHYVSLLTAVISRIRDTLGRHDR
jgi:hypothetical protein